MHSSCRTPLDTGAVCTAAHGHAYCLAKRMRITVSVLCFLFVIGVKAIAASNTSAPNQVPNPSNPTENVASQKSAAGASVPTDSQIVEIVENANDADIDVGKLAEKKATNDEVRQYAKDMQTHHKDQNKKLKDLIRKQEIMKEASQTSKGIESVAKDAEHELKKLGGIDFDRAYMASEVSMHQMVLGSLDQDLIPNAESKEVKQYLQNLKPMIVEHLKKAKALEEKISSSAGITSGKDKE